MRLGLLAIILCAGAAAKKKKPSKLPKGVAKSEPVEDLDFERARCAACASALGELGDAVADERPGSNVQTRKSNRGRAQVDWRLSELRAIELLEQLCKRNGRYYAVVNETRRAGDVADRAVHFTRLARADDDPKTLLLQRPPTLHVLRDSTVFTTSALDAPAPGPDGGGVTLAAGSVLPVAEVANVTILPGELAVAEVAGGRGTRAFRLADGRGWVGDAAADGGVAAVATTLSVPGQKVQFEFRLKWRLACEAMVERHEDEIQAYLGGEPTPEALGALTREVCVSPRACADGAELDAVPAHVADANAESTFRKHAPHVAANLEL